MSDHEKSTESSEIGEMPALTMSQAKALCKLFTSSSYGLLTPFESILQSFIIFLWLALPQTVQITVCPLQSLTCCTCPNISAKS